MMRMGLAFIDDKLAAKHNYSGVKNKSNLTFTRIYVS